MLRPEEDERRGGDLMGLNQRDQLEELVEGAEAAGEEDGSFRVFHEHGLAHEEVAERHAEVDPVVEPFLMGQFDGEAHRGAPGACRSAVGGLHDARSSARDHRDAFFSDQLGARLGALVEGIGLLGARRAEDCYRGAELGKRPESIDEFGLDAQDPPRVGVEPVGVGGVAA